MAWTSSLVHSDLHVYLYRTPPINAQYRSMPIKIMALIQNVSQCRSLIGIDRNWSPLGSMPEFWSTLIGIGHWSRKPCLYWDCLNTFSPSESFFLIKHFYQEFFLIYHVWKCIQNFPIALKIETGPSVPEFKNLTLNGNFQRQDLSFQVHCCIIIIIHLFTLVKKWLHWNLKE